MTLDKLWAGEFGDRYHKRNLGALSSSSRSHFWDRFYKLHPVKSVLEVGCGSGANLRWARAERIYGIDVNADAVALANTLPDVVASNQSIFDKSFPDDFAELVFTVGVLIHIEPARIHEAMAEMVRLSSRYVLLMEYHAPVEKVVPYRGEKAALWKRPYVAMMSERIGHQSFRSGFLGARSGFDRLHWGLWEKGKK